MDEGTFRIARLRWGSGHRSAQAVLRPLDVHSRGRAVLWRDRCDTATFRYDSRARVGLHRYIEGSEA